MVAQGIQVRCYEGRFLMEGEESLLRLACEARLGERNSRGFWDVSPSAKWDVLRRDFEFGKSFAVSPPFAQPFGI